jgi:hypothetical protein
MNVTIEFLTQTSEQWKESITYGFKIIVAVKDEPSEKRSSIAEDQCIAVFTGVFRSM